MFSGESKRHESRRVLSLKRVAVLSTMSPPLLLIPGPVPLAPPVCRAMSKPIINHRGPEFAEILGEVRAGLRGVLKTRNDVVVLTGSGSAAMEAAISNLTGPEDRVLVLSNGKFGARFHEIGRRWGEAAACEAPWGASFDLARVRELISQQRPKVVAFVHNETSTGLKNPASEICSAARESGALVVMDAITSAGGDGVEVDRWGVDLCVVGTQKCLGSPPGLAALAVSRRAWDAMGGRAPRYLNLPAYRKSAEKGQTPFTPAVSLFFALQESLRIIRREGLARRIARHRRMAKAVHAAAVEWGVPLFAKPEGPSAYSNTLTALAPPDPEGLKAAVKKRGVTIAGGQDALKGKIVRIAHMGDLPARDLVRGLAAVEGALGKEGGVEAARKVLGV